MFLYFIYGSGSAATTIESNCQSVRFLRVKRAGCARVRTAVAWRPHVVGFGDLRMIYVYACVKSTIVVLVKGCVRFIAYYLTLSHATEDRSRVARQLQIARTRSLLLVGCDDVP